ncbi:MAG: alginate O-acetyltransferase AlgX-related protein [Desulfosoma sp.]|uniref:alginate O-acetyltransferase AlgX-related protein n=1 Tax=Desulfosoma sp. TaxID=2603217 RepID=UPI00404A1F8C
MTRLSRFFDLVLIAGFLAGLLFPLLVLRGHSTSVTEKRALAPLPSWPASAEELMTFPSTFEKWFDDHFGGRHRLVQAYHLMALALGSSGTPRVLVGSKGWLYYTDPNDGNNVEDYRRTDPLTPQELERWRLVLETKASWLKSQGIAYLFLVVPNKHTIYPEYYPSRIRVRGERSRLDQFMDAMHGSDVPVMDLREPLRQAKIFGPLYHKTDSHWNALGAALAANLILEKLGSLDPGIHGQRFGVDDFSWHSTPGGDLARMLSLSSLLREVRVPVIRPGRLRCAPKVPEPVLDAEDPDLVITTCRSEGKSAVVFRDSFFTGLRPFFSEHFTRTVYTTALPEIDTLEQFVRMYAPDVVLEERVERYLKVLPKAPDSSSEPYRALLEARRPRALNVP